VRPRFTRRPGIRRDVAFPGHPAILGPPRRSPAAGLPVLAIGALLAGAAIAGAASSAAAARAEGPDSLRLRLEIGASADYTNELFYEDTFDSTAISTGRQLVDSPERRYGGVLLARLAGTRARQSTDFAVQNELQYGDLLQRDLLSASYRSRPSEGWMLLAAPEAEYRHDRTFDRDLEEWRGRAGLRARRTLDDGVSTAELSTSGDILRARGRGSEFVLDRNAAKVALAFERSPLWGPGWRVGYGLATRVFPDSGQRDHLEHGMEGQVRLDVGEGRPLLVDAGAERRSTLHPAPTSRDNYWEERSAVETEIALAGFWSLRARVEGEAIQYDVQDSTLYFDYQILRARAGPRFGAGRAWSVTVGPRGEALFSRLDPSEGYQEIAGAVELECLGRGAWWSVTPAAGWRDYDELPVTTPDAIGGLHSSYAFYEIGILGDQVLPGGLRLRAFANARYESHIDATQDARSLYFSLDLRRLF
jgi:hypothetical protein